MSITVTKKFRVFADDSSTAQLMNIALEYYDNGTTDRTRAYFSLGGGYRLKKYISYFISQMDLDKVTYASAITKDQMTLPTVKSTKKAYNADGSLASYQEFY